MIDEGQVADWDYNPETLTTTVHVPLRDKGRAVQVVAYASPRRNGRLSALGEAHNRQLVHSDLGRLLGDACPADEASSDASSVDAWLEAALTADGPGRADAIARLGGPFVRIVELTTPEEAAQCLGRLIVGGPVDKSKPYTLSATFTLNRAGTAEQRTVEIAGAMEAQIVDVPFAFDGEVQAAQWSAEMTLTWQGHTQTLHHTSQPLFPTIPSWQAVVYDREKAPLGLAQVVDTHDGLNETLDWEPFVQRAERLRSVTDVHVVFIGRKHRERLQAGDPLAAYAVTTVTSPDDRQAVLRFGGGGEMAFTLNGQAVEVLDEAEPLPLFPETQRTEVLHLHRGENVLVVRTQPQAEARFWALGAALTTVDGKIMTDLAYA
jgi:hypothetical protein